MEEKQPDRIDKAIVKQFYKNIVQEVDIIESRQNITVSPWDMSAMQAIRDCAKKALEYKQPINAEQLAFKVVKFDREA